MPTRLTDKPLPKPSEIRTAISELWHAGYAPLLDREGLSFVLPVEIARGRRQSGDILTSGPGRVLSAVVRDFGVPPQIPYYNRLGFDVRWDGVDDDGSWRLTLVDRRPDSFRDLGSGQISIDAHYESE